MTRWKARALIAALAAPAAVAAQEADATSDPVEGKGQVGPAGYELAGTLRDRQLSNAIGEEIGALSDIIVRGDRITHAIMAIGGFAGLGGSEVVMPFEVPRLHEDQVTVGQATVGTIATADQLERLTAFDPDEFGVAE